MIHLTDLEKEAYSIVKFMELPVQFNLVEHPQTGEYVDLEALIDWTFLMSVVEKIESYLADDCNVTIAYKSCNIVVVVGNNYPKNYTDEDGFDINTYADSKKEAVYNAVVEFIKWYNNQNK